MLFRSTYGLERPYEWCYGTGQDARNRYSYECCDSRVASHRQSTDGMCSPMRNCQRILLTAVQIPYCILNSKSLDLPVEWWTSLSLSGMHGCNETNLKVVDLRAQVEAVISTAQRTPPNFEKVLEMMHRAEALENEYVKWIASLPQHWLFKTVAWNDIMSEEELAQSNCFSGKVDMYAGMWMANSWNMSRACRLLLSQITIRCTAWVCAPRDYRTTPEYRKAARLCEELIGDIIASVPSFLGGLPRNETTEGIDAGYAFPCGEDTGTAGKGISGLFLLWPLIAAATSDFATEAQRKWMITKLRFVGDSIGINQGAVYSGVCALRLLRRAPSC